jgi:hypothetical protein
VTGTDEEGNPIKELVQLKKAVTIDGIPQRCPCGSFEFELVDSIEFGYRTSGKNVQTSGDVEVADYKLATPLFITPLDSNHMLELTDYDRTYWCDVVKKMSFNLGSNIWVNEIRG